MVANRALAPSSKLAIGQWAAEDVFLGSEDELQIRHFYRAMDFLRAPADEIQKEVFGSTASLLNLKSERSQQLDIGRVVWVMDRRMPGDENRRIL